MNGFCLIVMQQVKSLEISHMASERSYTKKMTLLSDSDQKWPGRWQILRLNGLISSDDKKSQFIIKHFSNRWRSIQERVIMFKAMAMSHAYLRFRLPCLSSKASFLFVNKFQSGVSPNTKGARGWNKSILPFSLSNSFEATSLP